MAQKTIFGTAEVVSYIKVDKRDGRSIYYRVLNNQNIEISEQEYKENN